jgi:LacI family transcriptional regulator
MTHITIKDVAKALNCSISTVSRAFNDKYDIKPETRERILRVANEMGYSPNPSAKKLTQKCSYNIGVVVPEFINAYFPEVIIGIQEVFLKKGYQVLIMQSNEDSETELQNLKTLVDNFVDGIIVSLTTESENIDYLQILIEKKYPLVLFNRVSKSLSVSKVVFDDYKWMFFATEHLINQGITDLVHFSGPNHLTLSRNRRKGFIDAHGKHGISISEDRIMETGFLRKNAEDLVERLISEGKLPEGIVCVNDVAAFGVIIALKRNGYKIPEDVAVVGFTETLMAELIEPSLTSVIQPTYQIGAVAAKLLLKQIESDTFNIAETIVLDGKLNVRESSVRK